MMNQNSVSKRIDDQFRQTILWEFMNGEDARKESNHEENKSIRPSTQSERAKDRSSRTSRSRKTRRRKPSITSSDFCRCGHRRRDHQPYCVDVEDNRDCECTHFTHEKEDSWGYWLTDEEGHKIEGRV